MKRKDEGEKYIKQLNRKRSANQSSNVIAEKCRHTHKEEHSSSSFFFFLLIAWICSKFYCNSCTKALKRNSDRYTNWKRKTFYNFIETRWNSNGNVNPSNPEFNHWIEIKWNKHIHTDTNTDREKEYIYI